MTYDFKCMSCGHVFEGKIRMEDLDKPGISCPECSGNTDRLFHATPDIFIPPYFMTMKSDIFNDKEWADLKKNPDIERYREG